MVIERAKTNKLRRLLRSLGIKSANRGLELDDLMSALEAGMYGNFGTPDKIFMSPSNFEGLDKILTGLSFPEDEE
jgi:hypothetical protein